MNCATEPEDQPGSGFVLVLLRHGDSNCTEHRREDDEQNLSVGPGSVQQTDSLPGCSYSLLQETILLKRKQTNKHKQTGFNTPGPGPTQTQVIPGSVNGPAPVVFW